MRRPSIVAAACLIAMAAACRTALTEVPEGPPTDRPLSTQRLSQGPPPAAPNAVNVDTGAPLPPPPKVSAAPDLRLLRIPEGTGSPQENFNPDPGAWLEAGAPAQQPFFSTLQPAEPAAAEGPSVPQDRAPLERVQIEPAAPPPAPALAYGQEPLPDALALPRSNVRENLFIPGPWAAPGSYPHGQNGGSFPGAQPVPDRWKIGFAPWRRYTAGDTEEMPYFYSDPQFWHYYRQSTLKGDLPIRGQDIFLRLTASAATDAEDRKLPVPNGASASNPESFNFYGPSESNLFAADVAIEIDLFKGDTVFKPVDWLVRIKPVFDFNYVSFRATGQVSPSPTGYLGSGGSEPNNGGVNNPGDVGSLLSGGLGPAPSSLDNTGATARNRTYLSLQEAFVEKHLSDLSSNYDFCAIAVGNQTFNSDFRGFIFNDTNLGARLFGNYDDNRWQYNLALFDMREKDTNSDLNSFNRRGQLVAVANLYRQDTLVQGYTSELSVLASFDEAGVQYDMNGFLVRPAPIGTVVPHRVDSYYIGWTGDGHLGRLNLSDALYVVTGRDEFNGIAGRPVDILAEMAAIEVSYDRDWIRYTGSFFFASGDHDSKSGTATGFDSIDDNTNFTGGPFSYWVRQSFNLGGASVPLKQRFSLLPDLRAGGSEEGQSNFVNPGLILLGVGAQADLTPRLRAFANANYLWFDAVDPIKTVLQTNQAGPNIGTDLSLGFQWRPFLISNVIFSAGCGVLLPGSGYRDIYSNTASSVAGFTPASPGGKVDDYLYSAILAATFTY